MCLIWIIYPYLLLLAEAKRLNNDIYYYPAETHTSHCSRKLNATGQIGCSSCRGGNRGTLYFANSTHDLLNHLNDSLDDKIILALDSELFIDPSLMLKVRSSGKIAGLLVFSVSKTDTHELPPFSESSTCPNALYGFYKPEQQCNVTPAWNSVGTDYMNIDWPLPVVLIRDADSRSHLLDCFYKFNVNPVDDTRCSVEIVNHMAAIGSGIVCLRRQGLMSVHIFESPVIYCDELTGNNIVLSATNTTVAPAPGKKTRSNSSTILVAVRTDSRSMFDRNAFASQSNLPGVAVLVAVAAHLMRQPSFKNLELKRDIFFVFLDNEAFDYMGSRSLTHDLRSGHLAAFTGFPLAWNHIHSVIELGEIGLPEFQQDKPIYFMNMDVNIYGKTKDKSEELLSHFNSAAKQATGLTFSRPSDVSRPLPPLTSVQGLLVHAPRPLAHLVFSDHDGPPFRDSRMESFTDVEWPPLDRQDADLHLLHFANTLADALHRLVTDGKPLSAQITDPTPGDLMNCFVNSPNCSLFSQFASPKDVDFLVSLGTPIPTQSYLPINNREIKLSHVVHVLLMGLTGERLGSSSCPSRSDETDPYAYFVGYYNGIEYCYRTLLDLADRFAELAWVRSRVAAGSTSYVRWYRSASRDVDIFSIVFGAFLTLLTVVCVFGSRNLLTRELINPLPASHIIRVDANRNPPVENRHTTI